MGWIRVEDRLPKKMEGQVVSEMVICFDGSQYFDYYHHSSKTWMRHRSNTITHWRPKPSNPNEQLDPNPFLDELEWNTSIDVSRLGLIPELEWEEFQQRYSAKVGHGSYYIGNSDSGFYEMKYWSIADGGYMHIEEVESPADGKQLANEHHFAWMSEQLVMLRPAEVNESTKSN